MYATSVFAKGARIRSIVLLAKTLIVLVNEDTDYMGLMLVDFNAFVTQLAMVLVIYRMTTVKFVH